MVRLARSSLLGAKQGDTLESPILVGMSDDLILLVLLLIVVLFVGGVGFKVYARDQILVVPLRILVHGAMIVGLLLRFQVLFLVVGGCAVVRSLILVCRHGRHVDNREGKVKVFTNGVLEVASLVPGGTLKIESMNEDTFGGGRDCLVNTTVISLDCLLLRLSLGLDLIEGPLLFGVLPSDLLHGGSQETLRIIETGQPEGSRSLPSVQPAVELEVAIDQSLDPTTQSRCQP